MVTFSVQYQHLVPQIQIRDTGGIEEGPLLYSVTHSRIKEGSPSRCFLSVLEGQFRKFSYPHKGIHREAHNHNEAKEDDLIGIDRSAFVFLFSPPPKKT